MSLEIEIEQFNNWAATVEHKSGEWEFYYPDWDKIYDSVESCMANTPINSEVIEQLLYVLARDNEAEMVLDLLSKNQSIGYQVVQQGIEYPDENARWQIAVLIGRLRVSDAPKLLNEMINDDNEYVRRRALLALRDIEPSSAEKTALEWIESDDEYARMVALDTLSVTASPYLDKALESLEDDPSEVVKNRWHQIRQDG